MKNITKTFTETYNLDMEGRHGEWKITEKTYEEAVKAFDGWMTAVRMVEKTFNPETFEITTKVIKERSGKGRVSLLCDMLRCAVKYNAGYMDYKIAEMWNLNDAQRRTVITRGISNSIVRRMNDKAFWHFFDDKTQFTAFGVIRPVLGDGKVHFDPARRFHGSVQKTKYLHDGLLTDMGETIVTFTSADS
jgi:hypothetical protein